MFLTVSPRLPMMKPTASRGTETETLISDGLELDEGGEGVGVVGGEGMVGGVEGGEGRGGGGVGGEVCVESEWVMSREGKRDGGK